MAGGQEGDGKRDGHKLIPIKYDGYMDLLFCVFEIFCNKKLYKNAEFGVQSQPTEPESPEDEAQD